jgi:hypothetical protein
MYLDFTRDESYTPKKVSVRAGTGPADLKGGGSSWEKEAWLATALQCLHQA